MHVQEEFVGFKEYEKFVNETAVYRDNVYPVLGLAGECGEFVELVKKAWRKHENKWSENFDTDLACSELGDILWYITRICGVLDIPLEKIAEYNVEKLTDRKKNGKK